MLSLIKILHLFICFLFKQKNKNIGGAKGFFISTIIKSAKQGGLDN